MIALPSRLPFTVLIVGLFLTTSAAAQGQEVRVTDCSPPEAKLASIEHDSRTLSRSTIQLYADFLDDLEAHCRQSRSYLSDMVLAGRKDLRSKFAKEMTILEFGRAAATMMKKSGMTNADCTGTIALLVTTLGRSGG